MQRTVLNLFVDLASALIMFGMLLTGYVIKFPLPPGTNKEWMLWALTRHQWGEIHFWFSIMLLALILVHVCLHWLWLVTVVRQRLGLSKPTHKGVFPDGVVVALTLGLTIGGFAWIAHLGVQPVLESSTGPCRDEVPTSPPQQKNRDSPVETPPTSEPGLTWVDVYPILEKACLSCHGPQKQRASFRVDQPQNLSQGKEPWIIPGKSEASPLIDIVSGRRDIALPSRHRLPDTDVARLRRWIDNGAMLVAPQSNAHRN